MEINKDYFSFKTTNEDLTHERIIENVYKTFSEDFKVTYDYTEAAPKIYKGAKLSELFVKNTLTMTYTHYCYEIGNYILKKNIEVESFIDKEIRRFEFELGGSCIYNAVVYICLLVEERIIHKDFIKLAQGYYKHALREDFPSIIPFGKNHCGLHAWTTFNNSVIDFCIVPQENYFFNFKNDVMVFGEVPEGLDYVGYEESYETVRAYAEEIAAFSNMDYRLWILKHKEAALKVMYKALDEFETEFNKMPYNEF